MHLNFEELVHTIEQEKHAQRPGPKPPTRQPRHRRRVAMALHHLANRIDPD